MDHGFPELNLTQLQGIASAWARRYPSIHRIALYRHTGGGLNDQHKSYLMDICMDDNAPRDQIQQIQTACTPIDSSEFFQDLRDLYPDPGNFKIRKWELIERQASDPMPNPWIANICQGKALFERKENPVFPEINVDYLKEMADRWIKKYPAVRFDRILLYRYASDAGPSIPVKYAVVFEMLHYERIYEDFWDDSYEQTELKRMKGAEDPHERFIRDTNFWATIKVKPQILHSDFTGVYKNIAPEDWHREWEFIPQYKGLSLPLQVRVDEGCVVLYPSLNAEQQGKRGSFAGQVEIESENFAKVVGHFKTIGCSKIKDDEVVQLLEKNGIRYDHPKMTKDEVKAIVSRLRENEISNRIIALILEWPRIQNRKVKLESVIRRLPR
jgi:hypothetical protein